MSELDKETTDLAVVSDLRRATGRFPQDARLTQLIGELRTGNERFAELWAMGTVGTVGAHREDHKTIHHPLVGPTRVDCDVLVGGDSGCKIVIMSAVPGSADETRLRLAAVAGPPVDADGSPARLASSG
ncbi:hypothetical protein [Nonomuraea sp. NPDC052265]|uniref:MmyB family transcriptional regulator n=1 Tax=Nonomuraea sp. NPDC052265 TaxID=3364374 RepID=UPI0037C7FFE9